MFFRIVMILFILAGGYVLFGIGHFHWMYYKVENPKAAFQIKQHDGDEKPTLKLVSFTNYACEYCKQLHAPLQQALAIRKNIQYIVRPIILGEEGGSGIESVKIVLAAGLQGKFWEFHDAFMEYPHNEFPDDFVQELTTLYGLDHAQLKTDSQGEEVGKLIEENLNALNGAGLNAVPALMMDRRIYFIPNSGPPDLKGILDVLKRMES